MENVPMGKGSYYNLNQNITLLPQVDKCVLGVKVAKMGLK